MNFFATAAKGTEPALRDELREMRFHRVRADRGGVHFEGPLDEGYRACLWSRIAVRVLVLLNAFEAPDPASLYDGVRAFDWREIATKDTTIAVAATVRSGSMTHSHFVAQKTKDAIVDQLRDVLGARPSVDLGDPDVRVTVHIARDHAQVYGDLAGEALHRRGYRREGVAAPLKETLAAAILRIAGWDRECPLVDPMCGGGTIAIEAALWARNVAPGLARKRFGFERWASYDEGERARYAELCERAQDVAKREDAPVFASDIDPAAVAATLANARAAGVRVETTCKDVRDLAPMEPPGFVVCNPPYGDRLDASDELYRAMNTAFARLRGHSIAVLSGAPAIEQAIHARTRQHDLWNGPIECRLLRWDVA